MRRSTRTTLLGVTGFLMKDLAANPLDCTESKSLENEAESYSCSSNKHIK